MKIAGIIEKSLTHYPGLMSSVVFTQGCNFRCNYCCNPELAHIYEDKISFEERLNSFFNFLTDQRDSIEGVVITGGEPTIQNGLPHFLMTLKNMGLHVRLETNGSNPKMLAGILNLALADYVAVDIKAPFDVDKYKDIAGEKITVPVIANINKTIRLLTHSRVDYEVRTTLIKEKHSFHDLLDICNSLVGCKRYCIQKFESEIVFDKEYTSYGNYSEEELSRMIRGINPEIGEVIFR